MLIETKDLTHYYKNKRALNHLSIKVEEGQLLAYIGTNGAGKSTTIKLLTGLLKPSSGAIYVKLGIKIGMVFQDSVLDEGLSVRTNLESRASLYRIKNQDWLLKLIERLGLEDILDQTYGTLSGGQRRRVDIARALINQPDLLFLDEPTTGLDLQTRQAIWSLLKDLQRQDGLTIFLTTHYLEEADQADMTYIIDHGNVLAQGSAKALKKQFAKNHLLIKTEQLSHFSNLSYRLLSNGWLQIDDVTAQEALGILSDYQSYILDFDFQKEDINDVFLKITGEHLVDEEDVK